MAIALQVICNDLPGSRLADQQAVESATRNPVEMNGDSNLMEAIW